MQHPMRSGTMRSRVLLFGLSMLLSSCGSLQPAPRQSNINVELENRYALPGGAISPGGLNTVGTSSEQEVAPVVELPPVDGYLRVLFGTNRALAEGPQRSTRNFFANSRGASAFGYVDVSIPKSHTIGKIERPSIWKLEFTEDDASHMVIKDLVVVSDGRFGQLIRQYRGGKDKPTVAFVHGYNVAFADAAFRTAQIANDLGISSIPTFFSWASRADPAQYTVDENTALQSLPAFKDYLRLVARNSSNKVFLIAHSMGSRLVTQAIAEMIQTEPEVTSKVVHLVLAAPDLDATVFKEQILPALTKQSISVTLYASSRDKTLIASSKIHGCCRAGLGGSNIVIAQGLESIDATYVDTSFLGHSYFAETRPLLTDLSLLIAQRLPATSRPLLGRKPDGSTTPTHYFFRK